MAVSLVFVSKDGTCKLSAMMISTFLFVGKTSTWIKETEIWIKCESVIVILFVNWYTVGSLCCVSDEKKEKEEG